MPEAVQGEITLLLARWERGDAEAMESLAPLVYGRLREIAESLLRNERREHTLQATAVVNEVFLDLLRLRQLGIQDRGHFFAFAARLARRVLIDAARAARSQKRGLGWKRIPLDAQLAWVSHEGPEALDLAEALNELAELDAEKAQAVELRYFLGCTLAETAGILQVSRSTVERSLRFSVAWLGERLRRS